MSAPEVPCGNPKCGHMRLSHAGSGECVIPGCPCTAYAPAVTVDQAKAAVRASSFDLYRTRNGAGDPDRGRHRKDDPATIAKMRGEASVPVSVPAASPEGQRGSGSNYIADRVAAPEWVCFANGRTVALAHGNGRPYLVVGWEEEGERRLRRMAAAEDDAGCINICDPAKSFAALSVPLGELPELEVTDEDRQAAALKDSEGFPDGEYQRLGNLREKYFHKGSKSDQAKIANQLVGFIPRILRFIKHIQGRLEYERTLRIAAVRQLRTYATLLAEAQKEKERALGKRTHTVDWYAQHYGKLEDWARKRLPEDWRNEFFNCVANGLWGHADVGQPYECLGGGRITPSNYFRMDTAEGQLIRDQTARAETAEAALAEAQGKTSPPAEVEDDSEDDEIFRTAMSAQVGSYGFTDGDYEDDLDAETYFCDGFERGWDECKAILAERLSAVESERDALRKQLEASEERARMMTQEM